MKKILALALVLAVAPLASAAITWTVTGSAGAYQVALTSDEGVNAVSLAQMVGDGAITNAVWNASFTSTNPVVDLAGYGLSGYGAGTANITAPGVYASGDLITFDYAGTTNIDIFALWMYGMNSNVSQQASGMLDLAGTQIVVPEPMTMALLGLGGLFVRRRNA